MIEDFEPTKFDPSPWGARQRVMPRSTFRVAPTQPGIPMAPPMVHAPMRVDTSPTAPRERDIVTAQMQRVWPTAASPWRVRLGVSIPIIVLTMLALYVL